MTAPELSALETALVSGDVTKSINLLRNWLSHAQPGEPELLLRDCATIARPKLALLMRDLLSRFPATLIGAPVLLYARPDPESSKPRTRTMRLPTPEGIVRPTAELQFLGWLPVEAQLPVVVPFQPSAYNTNIPWYTIVSAVALFRSHPDVFDADSLEVPYTWWGDLFANTDAFLRMAGNKMFPYPDALEASRVLSAAAHGNIVPAPGDFLSSEGRSWAFKEGELFFEQCRPMIEEDI